MPTNGRGCQVLWTLLPSCTTHFINMHESFHLYIAEDDSFCHQLVIHYSQEKITSYKDSSVFSVFHITATQMDLLVTPATIFLIIVLVTLVAVQAQDKKRKKFEYQRIPGHKQVRSTDDAEKAVLQHPPGPKPFPIVGNLFLLSKYEDNPYEGFTKLAREYGQVFRLILGNTNCVVVNSYEAIREVLIKKPNAFDHRPNFMRWNMYFDGDRDRSLALCDWSDIQKARRSIVRSFLLLRQESERYNKLDSCLTHEMSALLDEIAKSQSCPTVTKTPVSYCAMNVFLNYLCSTSFDYSDPQFQMVTRFFDNIFEDINNGHPLDFLPWLSPLFSSYRKKLHHWASSIRQFILEYIIRDRAQKFNPNCINDLVDALLANHFDEEGETNLDWQNILFALEDLLGGSSAIGNVVARALAMVAKHPSVQEKLHSEIDRTVGRAIIPSMLDRSAMPYTEATILEVLRHTSSPIVPHVASEDTSIGGYIVEKGTVVFLNNYELNQSAALWDAPEAFLPERFILDGRIKKPSHYMPFSTGKRSCIGSKILMHVTYVTLTSLLQKYSVSVPDGEDPILPKGKLSLIGDGFRLQFIPRNQ